MKFFSSLICLFIVAVGFAQNDFSESDAKRIVDVFFEGFHEGDTLKMRSTMTENMTMQSAFTNKDGEHSVRDGDASGFLKAIAKRPTTEKWEERLLEYKVQIDGNLAHVWTPYEFWLNGNFSHCGANSFTIVKTVSGWKIINIIDSRKRAACNQE